MNHKVIAELQTRQRIAFDVLDPQVRVVKNSPTVQVTTASIIGGLLLTGNLTPAALLASIWLSSEPLTHLAAGGLACAWAVDDALANAIARLDAAASDVEVG